MNLEAVGSVQGLSAEEQEDLKDLLQVWSSKRARNELKLRYYEQKYTVKDLDISVPPPLRKVNQVVGWPAKAVDILAVRSIFDGFAFEDGNDHGLTNVVRDNRLKSIYAQAVTDELINSVAFLTVSKGGEGEPEIVISAYSALNAAALWDDRLKRIKCGIAVIDVERMNPEAEGEPIWVNLYTSNEVIEIHKENGRWRTERHPHSMGRPTMEPIAYRPRLDRPFGKSRISRNVMAITDNAVRESLRTEIASEFFTTPQRYILGADESLFDQRTKYETYIGSYLALTKDADGEAPSVGQFAAMSMEPHISYKRNLAAEFSGETCVPISELGIISDNPASAEAIYAAKESLVIEAEKLNESNGYALETIAQMALAMMGNKSLKDLDDEERRVQARFKSPARPSVVSQSDAITKLSSAIPGLAESDVALEEVGFDEEQILRIKADREKARAQQMIEQTMQNQGANNGKEATMYQIASILKSYRSAKISSKNAITLFAAIGIDETEARSMLADAGDVSEAAGGGTDGGGTTGSGTRTAPTAPEASGSRGVNR